MKKLWLAVIILLALTGPALGELPVTEEEYKNGDPAYLLTAKDKEYFSEIKDAILNDDREMLADRIYWPIVCYVHGHKIKIKKRM